MEFYSFDAMKQYYESKLNEVNKEFGKLLFQEFTKYITDGLYYAYDPQIYTRTGEFLSSFTYDIKDTNIIYYFDESAFMTIDLVHHHAIAQGLDGLDFAEKISGNEYHDDFIENILAFFEANFENLYKYCFDKVMA